MLSTTRQSFALLIIACAAANVAVCSGEVTAEGGSEQFFESKVRPLLVAKCFDCHGAETQESDLRLDSRAAILEGGASSDPAAIPGDPDSSLLIQAVERSDDLAMPPDEPLSKNEVAVLKAWIKSGMPWPATAEAREPTTMAERVDAHVQQHWAYQPVLEPTVADATVPLPHRTWLRRQLDSFVASKLAEREMEPSPAADRRTLIRRLSFDLTGLPPSPEATAAFVADPNSDAYEMLVDRMLASPSYGERWGRHWLDVARYADTRGYAFQRDRRYPFAYTYRDYVVRAFNGDLPYDQFVVEQLAADQLELQDRWPLAALGFLTVGRKYNNTHDDIDDKIDVVTRGLIGMTAACARCHDHKYDAIPTEDYYALYGVFGSSREPDDLPLIGDASSIQRNKTYLDELAKRQRDLGEFVSVQHAEILEHARSRVTDYLVALSAPDAEEALVDPSTASFGPEDLRPQLMREWFEFLKRRARKTHPSLVAWATLVRPKIAVSEFAEVAAEAIKEWNSAEQGTINPLLLQRLSASPPQAAADVARVYGELLVETFEKWKELGGSDRAIAKLPQDYRQLSLLLFDAATPTAITKGEIKRYLVREFTGRYAELRSAIDAHQANAPSDIERAMIVRENRRPLAPRVFLRGDANRKGNAVPRRYLTAIHAAESLAAEPGLEAEFLEGSGRLELARRIASRTNPLTARVIVNRVWMHHFGRPLVATPSDFGVRSAAPLHQGLLDYLAWYLMEHDWSIKSLQREILLSATYRQSSAERTEALAADPENSLLWRMNRRRMEFEPLRDSLLSVAGKLDLTMGGRSVNSLEPPYPPRRSIYTVIDRQDLPNLLRAFDLASPDQSAEKRAETTVPQQALFLLNSPFVMELAEAVAERVVAGSGSGGSGSKDGDPKDVEAGIGEMYALFFQREPSSEELQVAQRLLYGPKREENVSDRSKDRWKQLAQALMLTNEFCFVD